MKIKSFYISDSQENEEAFKKFNDLHWKERKSESELIVEAIKEFVHNHSDGNPHSTIDQFTKDSSFQVCPALFRDKESIRKYLLAILKTPRWYELGTQLNQAWVEQFNELDSKRNHD